MYENIEILSATYADINDRQIVICEYADENGLKKEAVPVDESGELFKKTLKKFSYDDILKQTQNVINDNLKFEQDLQQFIQYKETGKIIIEESNDTELSIEKIENLSVEQLFKLKLDIFNNEDIQNLENKDIRSALRKSKNIFELLHYYYIAIHNKSVVEDSNEKNISIDDIYKKLQNITPEELFKLKLNLFEESSVQECENTNLRSNLRKSVDIFELIHHYYSILNTAKEQSSNQNPSS